MKSLHAWLVCAQVLSPGSIGIWSAVFLLREENQSTLRTTYRARQEPTTNSTHIWNRARIKTKPNWWEPSALTTVSSLLPPVVISSSSIHIYQQIRASKDASVFYGSTISKVMGYHILL